MDHSRILKFSQHLRAPCLIEQAEDLFYLTGLHLSKGRLLILPNEAILFVDGRYYDRAKQEAPCTVMLWDEFKKRTEKRIFFDSVAITYEGYLSLKKTFSSIEWEPLSNPLKEMRAIKEPGEIEALKKAALLTLSGIEKIKESLREGVSEEELALEFEIFCRKNGASGLSFEPIIAFGENSAYPHYRAGKSRLKKGQIVLIDVGAVMNDYHGDMTRIFYFGDPDPRILHFEKLVKNAQKKAIAHVAPGIKIGELDQIVQDEFDKAHVKPLYIHSLGHGIGLQTHEFPRIRFDGDDRSTLLRPGMVFTVEPGLYQPGVGGVRIEDMVVVTETGGEVIQNAIVKHAEL